MSTSSGASLKGEKGKKFQCLDINNLYIVNHKGESSDSHQQKNTASRKHGGMQPLGKVTQSRRAPVNLPSLKSEHSGNDPTLSLVPTGGTGWGSKPGETGPLPSTQPTQTSTSPVSSVNHGPNAPVAAGTSVQPSNLQAQTPPTQPQVMMKTVTTKVDKTWSSVMSPPDSGLNFMATQSRFDQEFPSLSGAGAGQVLPGKTGASDSSSGLSLRPQTEGSWIQGGTSKSATPQHPYLPQETTGGSRNNNLGQFGVAGVQVGPSSSPPQSLPPQFKQIVPSFMQNMDNRNSGTAVYPPPVFPGNFQNNVRSRYNGSSENTRFSPGLRNLSAADSDEIVVSRPIIRDEDLTRIDEISRDTSWATQEHIDFNEKLDFRDDDSTGADDEKDVAKEKAKAHSPPKESENEIDHIVHQLDKPWHGRGPPMPSQDYRGQISRNIHSNTRDEYEWEEKRKTSEKTIQSAVEKAKQRKEAEEKRFEESRSKIDDKIKKKEDSYSGTDWDKDEKPSPPVTTNKGPDSFRQMAQIDSRGFNRDRAAFSKDVPPRFQNKSNQSYNRNQQQPNSNFGKIINRRDYDLERDKPKDDDKDRRDSRQTPEPDRYRQRNDRYDRKSHYDSSDYSRQHQKYDERKDPDYMRISKDVEWEGRRGNAWDTRHHNDMHPRRDPKKFNDYNKGQPLFDDREDIRERPQRPDSREHPSRPDSRDSRLSRESRNSRESIREEPRNVETNHNYPWVDDYDKSLREEKNRKKDTFKEEPIKREIQPRRENRVFGPITPEKLEEHEKKSQARLEKEIIGTPLTGSGPKEESWSKLQPGSSAAQSGASWNEPIEEVSKPADYQLQTSEESEKKEDTSDKVKELKDKDIKRLSTRGGRGGGRQPYSSTGSFLTSRHNSWNNRDSRRGGKPSRWNGSESDMSDEISVSTESGKEDKKDRKQRPRSNERKKDKDDRNQVKKEEKPAVNRPERKQQPIGSYEQPAPARKEGFHPTGEPSRRGRGGGSMRGSRGNMGGHYGMPNTKSPFPTHSSHSEHLKNEDDDKLDKNLSNDLSDFSIDKNKPHSAIIIGFKNQMKDQRKTDTGKAKSKGKGSGDEDFDSGSECSESDSKGKHSKQKFDKNKPRPMTDKRPFNSNQINGRPSRVDDKDNGFQEVKSKKIVKEPRSSSKDDLKRGNRPKDAKGKSLQGPPKSSAGKPFRDNYVYKPPRMQKKLQHDVTELNKVNETVNVFPLTNNISSPAGPIPNAWEKPPKLTNSPTMHMSSTLVQEKSLEIIDPQSATNSQTSSPAEKVLNKISREGDKVLLPPVQTVIFENTNFKPHNDFAMKAKYAAAKGQRIEKGRGGKLDEELDGSALVIGGTYKPGDLKSDKAQDSLHMAMSFNKNEDNADMKLDFQFDSDLTLSEEKSNTPHSIHLGQAADLNQKIASVQKIWDVDVMDQHHDESPGVVSTSSSSFTSNFGTTVDTSLDHSSSHPVDDSSFSNTDVYSTSQIQASTNYGQTSNLMKSDPSNSAIKPQPTQAAVMSSALGNHSGPNLSSPPPQFPQSHFNYQNAYQNLSAMPSIPSPPTQAVISLGAQPVSNQQGELYHSFQLSTPMMGNQAGRSNYTGYSYGTLGQNLGQSSAYGQQSLYHHVPPATNQPPPDMGYGAYRIPSGYGQSQQISNPAAVLITSSTSSSLMSASVKSTQTLGAIGTKAYQSSPTQVQLGYMAATYDAMLPTNYLRPGSVPAALQQSTSYYSAGGQTGLFPPSNSLISTGNQPGLHSTFGMQGFNTAGSNQGPSSNQVGPNNFTSQMGHFRNTSYLKTSNPQHPGDSKSPSTQDMGLNCVFSVGGAGQIPSPKSRNVTGNNSKPQIPSQQPSPTQVQQHKYTPYQQNMVMPGRNQLVGGYPRPGNNTSMLNNSNMGKFPQPIQRPQYSQQQQQYNMNQINQPQRHRVQNTRQPPQHKMPNQYYPQPSNVVKIDGSSLDSKGDSDKLQDGSSATKVEKKEETAVNSEQ